jgi:hypothetical protein
MLSLPPPPTPAIRPRRRDNACDPSVRHYLSALCDRSDGNHAHRRLSVFLSLHGLWGTAAAQTGRLLRILLLRLRAVPARTGPTVGRSGSGVMLHRTRFVTLRPHALPLHRAAVAEGTMGIECWSRDHLGSPRQRLRTGAKLALRSDDDQAAGGRVLPQLAHFASTATIHSRAFGASSSANSLTAPGIKKRKA